MSNFVKPISEIEVDIDNMIADFEFCREQSQWSPEQYYGQIGLRHRPNITENHWWDSEGSLHSRGLSETDFSVWNEDTPQYTRNKIEEVCEHLPFNLGRVRYMTMPPQTGLKIHFDDDIRLHYVIKTNPDAYLFHKPSNTENLEHFNLKLSSNFYLIDTTQWHFVYNSGWEERVHLVIS